MTRSHAFLRRIGTCPKCMRESFLAAAASWVACLAAGLAGAGFGTYLPLAAGSIVAGLLTLLWLVHLVVFAVRALPGSGGAPDSVAPVAGATMHRRAFVLRFASVVLGAAMATGLGRRAGHAAPWYQCGGAFCGGNACCPASHPMLNHCDCRCYQSSSDFNNCGSYNQCVLDGSNCQG